MKLVSDSKANMFIAGIDVGGCADFFFLLLYLLIKLCCWRYNKNRKQIIIRTNTDAVLLEYAADSHSFAVRAACKTASGDDLRASVATALAHVRRAAGQAPLAR